MTVYVLNNNQASTGVGPSAPQTNQSSAAPINPPTQTFVAVVSGTGAVSATVQPQGSNDGQTWINLGSGITIASGASPQAGSQIVNSTFQYFRANVTALSGTGAVVNTTMAV
jgi:hypothetical protein